MKIQTVQFMAELFDSIVELHNDVKTGDNAAVVLMQLFDRVCERDTINPNNPAVILLLEKLNERANGPLTEEKIDKIRGKQK